MYEDPEETPAERATDPAARARERADEFRIHAELCAVFEGAAKFDAKVDPRFDLNLAREVQKSIAKLEKARAPETPMIVEASMADAAAVLNIPVERGISTNDYHAVRRPGELLIVRWLAGEEVENYYGRLQAHVDAALTFYREEERSSHGWKNDAETTAYLDALDAIKIDMQQRYLRPQIKEHKIFILSTQTADELDILHLTDTIMRTDPAQILGPANELPDEPTERDRAWFFKLFALRGIVDEIERMCFFAFLQKSDDF